MTMPTSFAADIRPLLTERDIQAMSEAFDLANHDDVGRTQLPSVTAFEESAAPLPPIR
jgi:hypothetical protein